MNRGTAHVANPPRLYIASEIWWVFSIGVGENNVAGLLDTINILYGAPTPFSKKRKLMIAFISLTLYLTVVLAIMYYSSQSVIEGGAALVEAVIMVILVSGIPALLGVLNGINFEKKHGNRKKNN